ncbi:MAG: hypothetical protein PHU25_10560 [Deltaproteobacteria bacterium]|nr:hypothetical protein [Deltaproteobacteria bacterium]
MTDDRKSDHEKISESVPANDFLLRNHVMCPDPFTFILPDHPNPWAVVRPVPGVAASRDVVSTSDRFPGRLFVSSQPCLSFDGAVCPVGPSFHSGKFQKAADGQGRDSVRV